MIPFQYLALCQVSSAGVVTAEWNFTDGARYELVNYVPTVAGRRRSRLGGNGDYADVTDSLTVHVVASSAAQCVANLDSLILALDTAARWRDEQGADVIHIRAQVQATTVGTLAAVVFGAAFDTPPASPSPTFDETTGRWIIRDVVLRFVRRGLWLTPTQDTAATGTITVGEIATVALASHPTLSPTRFQFEGVDWADNAIGYVLAASEAAQMQIFNCSSSGTINGGASVADAAGNYARGGNVLRFTAASGATVMNAAYLPLTIPNRCTVAHLFCNARPGSAAAAWDVQAIAADNANFLSSAPSWSGVRVPVPAATTVSLMYLGAATRVEAWSTLQLVARVSASAYPQTLDLSTLVILAEDDTSSILYVSANPSIVLSSFNTLTVDPRPLSHISPMVSRRDSVGDTYVIAHQALGEAYSQQRGAALATMLYAIKSSASTVWRPTNTGPSGPATLLARASRWKGYRVPQ
jgi:hypothetical protein